MRLILILLLAACAGVRGATLDSPLPADADTCLIETSPTNNMGGATYFNAGTNMQGKRNRGLVRFDLSAIPPGSVITDAVVTLWVVGVPTDGPEPTIFDLHRMLRSWGEGAELPLEGAGRGAPATTNEATWNDRFAYANAPWLNPGGEPDVDFISDVSAEKFISSADAYDFRFGTLVQDVQFWLDQPDQNFGYMVMTRDESMISSARRFGSHEDPGNTPTLDVSFIPATRIDAPQVLGNQMTFSFVAFANQPYTVEYRDAIGGSWNVLTNVPVQSSKTNIIVTDALSNAPRFYRVTAD